MTTMLVQLPTDIILEILSRVPSEYAIQCKEVCKTWRNLLRHIKVNLLYAGIQESHNSMQLYQGDKNLRLDEQLSHNSLTLLGDPCIDYTCGEYTTNRPMVGSHRGLVCFHVTQYNLNNDHIYICNPSTKETVLLPRLLNFNKDKDDYLEDFLVSGFGYLNSTNEYKVVVIYYGSRLGKGGQVQVYTLGDKIGWRMKDITYHITSKSNGVLSHGALHWLDDLELRVIAFDLAVEEFRTISLPYSFVSEKQLVGDYHDHYCQLLTLGGCLSIAFREYASRKTEIWSLKEPKRKGYAKCWSKEFSIRPPGSMSQYYHILSITEENRILLFKTKDKSFEKVLSKKSFQKNIKDNILCRYDPNTSSVEEFVGDGGEIFKEFQAIPYMKSDVSLTVLEPDLQVVKWDHNDHTD